MIKTDVYIDCVDRWCLSNQMQDMVEANKISDNGLHITIETPNGSIAELNQQVFEIINNPTWSFN